MNEIRPLTAEDVEVRVGAVGYNADKKMGWASMLLYKNARIDMAILDEVYGPENWQRDHKEIKGVVYCGIGVYDEHKGLWVWKWDAGTESNTEKEKGEASDSFKRAGFNWGIGRELYTTPPIYLDAAVKPRQNGRGYELANPWEMKGIKVSELIVDEKDGKRFIQSVTLTQKGHVLTKVTAKEV